MPPTKKLFKNFIVPQTTAVSPNLSTNRAALRRFLLAQRASMGAQQRLKLEGEVLQRLTQHLADRIAPNSVVSLYSPHAGELNILRLLQLLPLLRYALPVVIAPRQALSFAPWATGDELSADRYGIATPSTTERVTPDVVMMPCVGYSQQLGKTYRVGYGGGYYDRTVAALLANNPQLKTIGIALRSSECVFDVQPHDAALDTLIAV